MEWDRSMRWSQFMATPRPTTDQSAEPLILFAWAAQPVLYAADTGLDDGPSFTAIVTPCKTVG